MKIVINQVKFCDNNNQLFNDYPILNKYRSRGHYVKYSEDCSDYDTSYWRENCFIIELCNDELFKLLQELTNESRLIIGYADKRDHKEYGIDFTITMYDDYLE